MREALLEAQKAIFHACPNPAVGCVIVTRDGVARGHTQPPGSGHAEVQALRQAREAGWAVEGSTVYVTLEPCSHFGRTPPCADALIDAKVARVVVAVQDPNPLVAGAGIARLRNAGVDVSVGLLEHEAREINIGFFSRMVRKRPWVRVKIAASLDGRVALQDGQSQWITSPEARADGHYWRARSGAILTGVGTVLADDPQLNVRDVATTRQPLRVVADSRLSTPPDARLMATGEPVLIYAARSDLPASTPFPPHVKVVRHPGDNGRVDLKAMLDDLGLRGINELHVEAGGTLNGSLMAGGWVDEFLLYVAPKLIGPGRPMVDMPALKTLDECGQLRFVDVIPVGPDLRIRARPADRAPSF